MTRKMRSDVKGLILGRFSSPLPSTPAQKEPVAYLYNGVRLPKLPEWDKETYPYAVISQTASSGIAYLYCSPIAFVYNSLIGQVIANKTTDYLKFVVVDGAFVAEEHGSEELDDSFVAASNSRPAIWTNTDIYGMSDTTDLHLAASEPVPVYE